MHPISVPSDPSPIEPSSQAQAGGLSISNLDDFKSVYCFLNTKPDSQIKLLKGVKRVGIEDIYDLNAKVERKLYNHNIITAIPNIQITFGSREIKEYSSWEEFSRTDWNLISETVDGVTITWQILIKNSNTAIPQPHILKVRIGNEVPPKDALQLLMSADNPDELMQLSSPSLCRVDFVNSMLAEELLDLVEKWHASLLSAPRQNPFPFFLHRHGMQITEFWRFLAPILFLLIASRYADLLIASQWFRSLTFEMKILYSAIIIITVYKAGSYAGYKGEAIVDTGIKKLKAPPAFSITKGDRKRLSDATRKNSKFIRDLSIQLLLALLVFCVTAYAPNLLKLIFRL